MTCPTANLHSRKILYFWEDDIISSFYHATATDYYQYHFYSHNPSSFNFDNNHAERYKSPTLSNALWRKQERQRHAAQVSSLGSTSFVGLQALGLYN